MKAKDQERALAMIDADPGLHDLRHLRGPYLDLEARCFLGCADLRCVVLLSHEAHPF